MSTINTAAVQKIKNQILLGASLLLLCACNQAKEPGAYIRWVEDQSHGLVVQKEIDDIEYTLVYKPCNYILAKEYETQALRASQFGQRRKELEGMQYFTLKLKSTKDQELLRAGIRSENDYYARLEYFMSGMQNDLCLVQGKDTLPCLMHHYERSYGLSPYNNIVLAFENKPASAGEDKLLVYDDKVLGSGKVMLKIRSEDIADAPSLALASE